MATTTTTTSTTQASPTRDFFEDRRRALTRSRHMFAVLQRLERPSAASLSRMHVLLLTTTGRKSGLPRTTPLAFTTSGASDGLFVASRMGQRSDWYQNLLARPEVTVQTGTRSFAARAEPVLDPNRRRELVAQLVQVWDRNSGPRPMRWLMRLVTGIDSDQFLRDDLEHADQMPCVLLTPQRAAASIPNCNAAG